MFCDRLKKAMEIRKISTISLANKLNVNKGTVSLYCSGKRFPKYDRVKEIARILNVSEDWLLEQSDQMEVTTKWGSTDYDEMIQQFSTLSYEQKFTVKTLIRTLYDQNITHKKEA